MGHFHNVIGLAVYPEVDITQLVKRVVVLESGKCNDANIKCFCSLGCIQHIGRTAAATDQDQQVAFIAVEFNSFFEHQSIAIVVGKTGERISLVKVDSPDPAALVKSTAT